MLNKYKRYKLDNTTFVIIIIRNIDNLPQFSVYADFSKYSKIIRKLF